MQAIDLSTTPSDASSAANLLDICRELGFDYAAYATIQASTGNVLGHATYPIEWQKQYLADNLHLIDPTLSQSLHSTAPIEWSRFTRDDNFNTVFSRAHEFGISTQGVTIPIRGPFGDFGILNVTRNCPAPKWNQLLRHAMAELQLAAVLLHDAVLKAAHQLESLSRPVLSQREIEILQWVAEGKSQQDIGDILAISHRTVEVHLRSIRVKLGALTTPQAIGRAIGFRLIQPG